MSQLGVSFGWADQPAAESAPGRLRVAFEWGGSGEAADVRVLVVGIPGAGPPPRQVHGYLALPTGVAPLAGAGVFGAMRLRVARMKIDSGTLTVTVTKNGVAVPGWDGLAVTTTPADFAPDASPVEFDDGDTLALSFSGTGTGLSFGFTE